VKVTCPIHYLVTSASSGTVSFIDIVHVPVNSSIFRLCVLLDILLGQAQVIFFLVYTCHVVYVTVV